ncbi:MAG: Gfo/Idh/MocA family oxidoreductase [Victivallaceae bacterium]|nr:Gfo/Idh/MocA family oxidoreductase [Victivallaceae bacterium]
MIRYGIIGAGRMGNNHACQIQQLDNATVTAVYDIRPEASAAFREKFGARICNSATELARSPDVDCVVVTSPSYCHREGVEAAIAAKKPIFCEKALCRSREDAEAVLKSVEAYDKLFTVGFVRRHMQKTIVMKQLIAEGKIGKIRYCNVDLPLGCYCRKPGDWFADFDLCGGVIIDMLAHHIDLANWFFGPAKRIYADGMLLTRDQPDPSDYVASVVTYANGVICNMSCSWQRFGRSNEMMEVYGDEGALVLDSTAEVIWYPKGGEMQRLDPVAETEKRAKPGEGVDQVNIGDGFFCEFRNLTAALEGKPVPLPTVRDAWNSLEVSFAMIESVKTGKAVTLK